MAQHDSARVSVNGALASDTTQDVSASPFKLYSADGQLSIFITMGNVLVVAGVAAAALQPSFRAVVRVEDGNIFPASIAEGTSPAVDNSDGVMVIDSDLVAAID